jgi:hypothetical protein
MPKTPATSSNLKNSKSTEPLCQIDLGQVPPFTTNYLGNAPLPVLAAYGTAPLHRFLLQREEWEHDRILADKERGILRSDRGESMRGLEWRDIVVDEGAGVFIHIDNGRLSAFAPDLETAKKAALAFRTDYARPRNKARGCYHLITNSGDNIDTEVVELAGEISIGPEDLDLHYGAGFSKWTDSYVEKLSQKNSGLTVFEGPPGTGKTSYLRHLMFLLKDTHRFYFIPPANAGVLSNPEFIGFWSQQHAAHPSLRFVCVLEDAEGALMTRGTDNRRQVGAILNITDGLLADFLRLHIVCSINCKSTEIDAAFMRPGRLVAHHVFSRIDSVAAHRIAAKASRSLPLQSDYSLAEIFNSDPMESREKPRIGFAA